MVVLEKDVAFRTSLSLFCFKLQCFDWCDIPSRHQVIGNISYLMATGDPITSNISYLMITGDIATVNTL